MEAKRPLTAVAITFVLLVTAVAALVPPAQAHHTCSFSVGADANHSPANTWTTHNSPRFTFDVNHCRVHYWGVQTSWGGYFTTYSSDYHPSLPSGEYSVSARAYYSVDSYNNYWHCHYWWWGVCLSWHYHSDLYYTYYWSGFVASPKVKIDITIPNVDISSIDGPFVDDKFLTSDTTISISASDAHSGIAAVQTAQDGAAWSAYTAPVSITGDDGLHTLNYRAIDNVGLVNTKARDFVLDNTAPQISIVHPTANSVNVDDVSAESCTENARVTQGDETLAEAPPAPELPADPATEAQAVVDAANDASVPDATVPRELVPPIAEEHVAAAEAAAAEANPGELPDVPAAPDTDDQVTEGPDACGGEVVETAAQTINVPGAPAAPEVPEAPETPELPEEVPDVPEAPAVPEAPVGPGDVLPPTLADAVEDALASVPGVPGVPGVPPAPDARSELESAVGPLPIPDAPTSVVVDAQDVDFANPVVLSGVVEMSADVADATVGTGLVEFIVDDVVRQATSEGEGMYSFSWDTTTETAGEHSFSIRATDRLGNVDSVSFTVLVVATTQEGVEATADATVADAEATAADVQADVDAAPGEVQAAVDAAPGEAQAAADGASADAEMRRATFEAYVQGRVDETVPEIPASPVPLPALP